jgi:hypothetical protein
VSAGALHYSDLVLTAYRRLLVVAVAAQISAAGCDTIGGEGCDPCGDNFVVNADIWGSPDGELFIAGYRGQNGLVRRLEMGNWVTLYQGGYPLANIWGQSSQDFFVSGGFNGTTVQRCLGGEWQAWDLGESFRESEPNGGQGRALWGVASDDVFLAGSLGIILHFDGTSWQPMSSPTQARLTALWGTAHDNVLAVGEQGTVLRYDGTAWSILPTPTQANLRAVWGSSPDNVFIVGEVMSEVSHVILRFDGTSVTTVHEGETALLGIHGASADRVYAVGAKRTGDSISAGVFRFDGTSWSEQSIGVHEFLWDVWVNPDGSYTAVGPDDTIFQQPAQ